MPYGQGVNCLFGPGFHALVEIIGYRAWLFLNNIITNTLEHACTRIERKRNTEREGQREREREREREKERERERERERKRERERERERERLATLFPAKSAIQQHF